MAAHSMSQQALVSRIQETLEHHKQGRVSDALQGYEEILPHMAASTTKVSILGNAGALYMNIGEYEKAKTCFMSAVDIAPDNAQVHFNLAVLLTSKLNQHAKAIRHCALAMKLDPTNYKAYHLMGNIMQSLGKNEDAERYFNMAESIAQGLQQPQSATTATTTVTSTTASSAASSSSSSHSNAANEKKQHHVLHRFYEQIHKHLESNAVIAIDGKDYEVQVVSNRPLIIAVDNFLTHEECDHIRKKAENMLEKSFVMGNSVKMTEAYESSTSGEQTVSTNAFEEDPALFRSSYTAWLAQDEVLHNLQLRLSKVLELPLGYLKSKSEDLQVVKYHIGGQFKAHQDSSAFHSRLFTALMYLNDVPSQEYKEKFIGGETWFPFAAKAEGSEHLSSVEEAVLQALNIFEDQLQASSDHSKLPGLKVEAKKGRVAIFFNYQELDGAIDPHAVHAGLPIRKIDSELQIDEKVFEQVQMWVANFWIDFDMYLLEQLLK